MSNFRKSKRCVARYFPLTVIFLSGLTSASAYAADWYVGAARQGCVLASSIFPAIGPNPASHTPADVAEFSRRAGISARVEYLSQERATVTTSEPGLPSTTYSMFANKQDCQGYLSFLATGPKGVSSKPVRNPFGIYKGEKAGIFVGIETKPNGTGIFVSNKTSTAIKFAPQQVRVISTSATQSPCTMHFVSLGGMGTGHAVEVQPGKSEGLLLGSCPGHDNDGKLGGEFIVRGIVKALNIDGIEIPVRPDN